MLIYNNRYFRLIKAYLIIKGDDAGFLVVLDLHSGSCRVTAHVNFGVEGTGGQGDVGNNHGADLVQHSPETSSLRYLCIYKEL